MSGLGYSGNTKSKNGAGPLVRAERRGRQLQGGGELDRLCVACGEPIPLNRLRAAPETPFCVLCQKERESGGPREQPVYCKECGAEMVWRVRESTLPTKYFLGCSNYPRCRFVIAGSW